MVNRRWADAGESERDRRVPQRGAAGTTAADAERHPVLGLQSSAGNAAVTALLGAARRPNVQRLVDPDDETVEPETGESATSGESGETAESGQTAEGAEAEAGGAADSGAFDAVQSEVEADLDPAAVTDALAPLATSSQGQGPGDFEVPETGVTAQALAIQRDPPDQPEPPRPGSPGDVLKALMPFLQPALDRLKANVLDALSRLKLGEKIVLTVVTAPIVLAPLTQPGPRRFALDQLDGTDVTFGVIPNLKVAPSITDGQLRGGTVTYDLAPALRKAGLPF
jgi:hypothetical protein